MAQNTSRKLRVMQVHTFYRSYLSYFYAAHPQLHKNTFNVQMRALILDGLAAIHIFTPYLFNCESMLVIANCAEAQLAWLKEHEINLINGHDWQKFVVKEQILNFKPDILYLSDSISFADPFPSSLPWSPPVVIGWRAADVPIGTEWSNYDIMLSGLPHMLELAKILGARESILFYPGMPSWIAHAVENIPQDIDVVFVGSISPSQHVRRLALLESLAEAAAQENFSLALHLSCDERLLSPAIRRYYKPPVYGIAMHKALRRGKIVFDTRGTIGLRRPDGSYALDLAGGDTANMRLFEATGGGSLVLTDSLPGLTRLFEPNKEIATFHDEDEMVSKIKYYLSHEEERKNIAIAGKKRCLEEWNMKRRVHAFLNIAQSALRN